MGRLEFSQGSYEGQEYEIRAIYSPNPYIREPIAYTLTPFEVTGKATRTEGICKIVSKNAKLSNGARIRDFNFIGFREGRDWAVIPMATIGLRNRAKTTLNVPVHTLYELIAVPTFEEVIAFQEMTSMMKQLEQIVAA